MNCGGGLRLTDPGVTVAGLVRNWGDDGLPHRQRWLFRQLLAAERSGVPCRTAADVVRLAGFDCTTHLRGLAQRGLIRHPGYGDDLAIVACHDGQVRCKAI